jgi:hypothetical protein
MESASNALGADDYSTLAHFSFHSRLFRHMIPFVDIGHQQQGTCATQVLRQHRGAVNLCHKDMWGLCRLQR